jgi:hypothetical protein
MQSTRPIHLPVGITQSLQQQQSTDAANASLVQAHRGQRAPPPAKPLPPKPLTAALPSQASRPIVDPTLRATAATQQFEASILQQEASDAIDRDQAAKRAIRANNPDLAEVILSKQLSVEERKALRGGPEPSTTDLLQRLLQQNTRKVEKKFDQAPLPQAFVHFREPPPHYDSWADADNLPIANGVNYDELDEKIANHADMQREDDAEDDPDNDFYPVHEADDDDEVDHLGQAFGGARIGGGGIVHDRRGKGWHPIGILEVDKKKLAQNVLSVRHKKSKHKHNQIPNYIISGRFKNALATVISGSAPDTSSLSKAEVDMLNTIIAASREGKKGSRRMAIPKGGNKSSSAAMLAKVILNRILVQCGEIDSGNNAPQIRSALSDSIRAALELGAISPRQAQTLTRKYIGH